MISKRKVKMYNRHYIIYISDYNIYLILQILCEGETAKHLSSNLNVEMIQLSNNGDKEKF